MHIIFGLSDFPWWAALIAVLVFCHITLIATTIYLHRHQAHNSIDLHPIVSHFFRFWLWFTTATVTKEWVSIHRKHHAKCDTAEDPHSPVIYGLKKVFWQGAELYRAEATNQDTLNNYSRGTPNDWLERNLYSRFSNLGVILLFFINLSLFGLNGIWMWGLQMLCIPVCAAGIINGLGHAWGYRNFDIKEAATNIVPWGFLICGEELHNNHHTYPRSAKLSVKKWEFDIGWWYISLFRKMKLVRVLSIAPTIRQVTNRKRIDYDTLSVLLVNHFQIVANYTKQVIIPVLKQEKIRAGTKGKVIFVKAKSLILREAILTEESKSRLTQVLSKSQVLRQVYIYRQRLNEIWLKTATSKNERLEALQEWCKQAEASGITVLNEFVNRLRSYVPQYTNN